MHSVKAEITDIRHNNLAKVSILFISPTIIGFKWYYHL